MQIEILSLFPDMVATVGHYGVVGRAVSAGQLRLTVTNPRDFATDQHRSVDDRPYGGGPGMVMRAEPLAAAIDSIKTRLPDTPLLYLSPQGRRLDQPLIRRLSALPALILLAGRYEGIDERILQSRVDAEISIGDYVLSGGELPAMVLIDAMARLLPGVLGDARSPEQDSFSEGLLDHPHYTRPRCFQEEAVPAVLLSGDHRRIRAWRHRQAVSRTLEKRPDLLARELALSGNIRPYECNKERSMEWQI